MQERLLGVDVGSRWCAASALDPGVVLASGTLDINPDKTKTSRLGEGPAVAWILLCAAWSGAERIAVEHSEEWAPWPGMSPAAQKVTQANWALCDRIVRALEKAAPIPVEIIHARSWRSRLFRAIPKPERAPEDMPARERRERTDALVRAALGTILPASSVALLSALCPPCASAVHQYDAAGVATAALMRGREKEEAATARPARSPHPPGYRPTRAATRNAAWLARRAASRRTRRVTAGCNCGQQHSRACPLYTRPARYRAHGAGPDGVDPLDRLLGLA